MTVRSYWKYIRGILSSPIVALSVAVVGIVVAIALQGAQGGLIAIAIFGGSLLVIPAVSSLIFFMQQRNAPTTPFELNHASYIWTIHDIQGTQATLSKKTVGTCRADGIVFHQEKSGGTGETPRVEECRHNNGTVIDIAKRDKDYIGIRLHHAYHFSDPFDWEFERHMRGYFRSDPEWVSAECDTKITGGLTIQVNLPVGVLIEKAWLTTKIGGHETNTDLGEGKEIMGARDNTSGPTIKVAIDIPRPGAEYSVWWKWNGGIQADGVAP